MNFRPVIYCDRKALAQRYVQEVHTVQPEHTFSCFRGLVDDTDICGKCNAVHDLSSLGTCHCAFAGLTCQPFTLLRPRDGAASKTKGGDPESHPDFDVVFEIFPKYAARRQPERIMIEEVCELTLLCKNSTSGTGGNKGFLITPKYARDEPRSLYL